MTEGAASPLRDDQVLGPTQPGRHNSGSRSFYSTISRAAFQVVTALTSVPLLGAWRRQAYRGPGDRKGELAQVNEGKGTQTRSFSSEI